MPEKAQHPLLVKIAPDLTDDDKEDIAAVVTREKVCFCGCVLSKLTQYIGNNNFILIYFNAFFLFSIGREPTM